MPRSPSPGTFTRTASQPVLALARQPVPRVALLARGVQLGAASLGLLARHGSRVVEPFAFFSCDGQNGGLTQRFLLNSRVWSPKCFEFGLVDCE